MRANQLAFVAVFTFGLTSIASAEMPVAPTSGAGWENQGSTTLVACRHFNNGHCTDDDNGGNDNHHHRHHNDHNNDHNDNMGDDHHHHRHHQHHYDNYRTNDDDCFIMGTAPFTFEFCN